MGEEEGETSLWSNDDIIYFEPGPGVYDLALLVGVIVAWQVGKFKQSN